MEEKEGEITEVGKDEKTNPRMQQSQKFQKIFERYEKSIATLREFFSYLNPVVVQIGEKIKEKIGSSVKAMSEEFREIASDKEIEEFNECLNKLGEKLKGKGSTEIILDDMSPLVGKYFYKFIRIITSSHDDIHHEILNRSILMSMISYFEILVSDLAHVYYLVAPDAVASDDKILSFNELKRFDSIDEAVDTIISDRVDKLLRGGVEDWRKFFLSHTKIDLSLVTPSWPDFVEYFQRRNLIVHNGGRVDEKYLSIVEFDKLTVRSTRPMIDDILKTDDTYVSQCLDNFEVTGLLFCQEIWGKLLAGEQENRLNSINGLTAVIYERLLSRHWYVAGLLAQWGEQDKEASETDILVCKFNRWLCMKRRGLWEIVKKEVEAFDCSAKNHRYELARVSLLEKTDVFFSLLPKVLGTDISIGELQEWPILEEIRKDARYVQTIKEAKNKMDNKEN